MLTSSMIPPVLYEKAIQPEAAFASETDPLNAMLVRYEQAATTLDLDPLIDRMLRQPERELEVSVPVRMDSGRIEVFSGYRIVHNTLRGPATGGVRYDTSVTAESLRAQAAWTTWQCALLDLPFGGSKGGMRCNPETLSARELEQLTRGYAISIIDVLGPNSDVPSPDVGTNAQTMAWILDEYARHVGHTVPEVVTGKPVVMGGSAVTDATGCGVLISVQQALTQFGIPLRKAAVAVQGFGIAGAQSARMLAAAGARVIAISDETGAIYDARGVDVPHAEAWARDHGSLEAYTEGESITNDDLLRLHVDVLVPAATDSVITSKNAAGVGARVLVEVANGPTTVEADAILDSKGVFVVPDILANSGDVTASWFEWTQNRAGYRWSTNLVNERLGDTVRTGFSEVLALSKERAVPMRVAAYMLAIGRVAAVQQLRGIHA